MTRDRGRNVQYENHGEGLRHPHRAPAGWPGLSAATRRAGAHRRHSGPESGPRRTPADDAADEADIQVRVLDRMVGLLTVLVESQERGAFDPDALGLATLMTKDLDRHLTDLMDAEYEPADDVRVVAIERALVNVRTRLGECAER